MGLFQFLNPRNLELDPKPIFVQALNLGTIILLIFMAGVFNHVDGTKKFKGIKRVFKSVTRQYKLSGPHR